MRFSAVIAAALPITLSLAATTSMKGTVSYDTVYDNSKLSTLNIACSDGSHGLNTKGYKTIGALDTYPYVGGAPAVTGWNSAACGSCYQLSYNGTSVYYTAIDKAKTFNMGLNAMNKLTGGKAKKIGVATVTYKKVAESKCGL
ncbi:allergen Asp f 15 precursor [Exidia glandulosa HHB12029]|uniref:Allergen Asp f 15 n=1 Tax=Exidia glandulosa HHB12029 TaxID=1314781 RepID=A0A165KRH3_EXIGL|nr:allergen Asp f 15 precursor [Exidia glandulosa HHB12029]